MATIALKIAHESNSQASSGPSESESLIARMFSGSHSQASGTLDSNLQDRDTEGTPVSSFLFNYIGCPT